MSFLACITRFHAKVLGARLNPPPPYLRSSPQNFNFVSSYNSCKLELCGETQVSVSYIHFHIGMSIKAVRVSKMCMATCRVWLRVSIPVFPIPAQNPI